MFLGRNGGAAFGDYVAGSNHVLPTGGAARFSGPLGASTFLRRQALVSLPDGAARQLAPHVGSVARAEGFPIHAESAEAGHLRPRGCNKGHGDHHARPRSSDPPSETRSSCELELDGSGRAEMLDRRGLLRPHARPARAPRAPGPGREGERRPRDGSAPHHRGRRHRARPGARPGARRPQRRSRGTATRWCRWTRRWAPARST